MKKMMEDAKPIQKHRINKPTDHKCSSCVWANWINDKKVLCTFSPVRCAKDGDLFAEET